MDPTFGAGGRAYLGWGVDAGITPFDVAVAVLARSDGGVIMVGNATDAGSIYVGVNAVVVARLTPAGQFDTSFGDGATPGQTKIHGAGNFPYSGRITANGAALQTDGNIVVTDPKGPTSNIGTVYLYTSGGKKICSFTGSSPNDQVGSGGIAAPANGNFVAVAMFVELE